MSKKVIKYQLTKWEKIPPIEKFLIEKGLFENCIITFNGFTGSEVMFYNPGGVHETLPESIFEKYFEKLNEEKVNRNLKIDSIINFPTERDKMIKEKIDEYLEFDCADMFKVGDLITIFGGAVRDSIADQAIHDIDILIGAGFLKSVSNLLEEKGYTHMPEFVTRDMDRIYSDILVISEPWTFLKGTKKVQLIRNRHHSPNKIVNYKDGLTPDRYKENYHNLIKNVDLSCCGVSFNEKGLKEDYPNAISHCEMRKYMVTGGHMTNQKRLPMRRRKLDDRGWSEIINEPKEVRDHKIGDILGNDFDWLD